MNPGFQITVGKGFQMVFKNGWTVSVQFGGGNYCKNYKDEINSDAPRTAPGYAESGARGCADAEIAAWDPSGKWYSFGSDTVKGNCTPDDVAKFMNQIARKRPALVEA